MRRVVIVVACPPAVLAVAFVRVARSVRADLEALRVWLDVVPVAGDEEALDEMLPGDRTAT
jgi:uncharacterized protein with ACT and thioredoxin-like domain